MFALLALFGDLGCGVGPGLVGAVSSAMGDQLNLGIAASTVFPILIVVGLAFLAATLKRKKER
jgi:MFS-type transporter involved in bile tolerance (Atg22 family)